MCEKKKKEKTERGNVGMRGYKKREKESVREE